MNVPARTRSSRPKRSAANRPRPKLRSVPSKGSRSPSSAITQAKLHIPHARATTNTKANPIAVATHRLHWERHNDSPTTANCAGSRAFHSDPMERPVSCQWLRLNGCFQAKTARSLRTTLVARNRKPLTNSKRLNRNPWIGRSCCRGGSSLRLKARNQSPKRTTGTDATPAKSS